MAEQVFASVLISWCVSGELPDPGKWIKIAKDGLRILKNQKYKIYRDAIRDYYYDSARNLPYTPLSEGQISSSIGGLVGNDFLNKGDGDFESIMNDHLTAYLNPSQGVQCTKHLNRNENFGVAHLMKCCLIIKRKLA